MKEKYLLMRDRMIMMSPAYWNLIVQTDPKIKKIFGSNVKKYWIIYQDGRHRSLYIKKEFENSGKYIARRLLNEKRFFPKMEKAVESKKKQTEKFISQLRRENFGSMTFSQLLLFVDKIKKFWVDFDILNVPIWFMPGEEFKRLAEERIKIPEKDFVFLSDPEEKSHASRFEIEYLKTLKKIKEGKGETSKEARKLSECFGWIPFGYDGPEFWDEKYFEDKFKKNKSSLEEIAKKIEEIEKNDRDNRKKRISIIKKHRLGQEEERLIKILRAMISMADDRKYLDFQLNYFYSQILWEMEKRFGVPYKNLKYLFTEELKGVPENKDKLLGLSRDRIKRAFTVEGEGGRTRILPNKETKKLIGEIEKQLEKVTEIKGIVASRGEKKVYSGKVKIVLSPSDSAKIQKGDFLVANMTSPDFLIAMKKATGFITDEGGMTCHAAIVAREMGKPCIIGTKVATKFLKDGDKIELDMITGAIKKID